MIYGSGDEGASGVVMKT